MVAWGLCLSLWCAAGAEASEVRIPSVVVTLSEQVDVPARDAGQLKQILVKEGLVVEEGQLIGQIDDQDMQLLLARAATELRQARELAENDLKVRFARKSADVAKAELQRAQDAAEKFAKSVSRTELDRLQLVAERSVLEIEQAEADLLQLRRTSELKEHDYERVKLQVERRRLTAPITGVVVQWKKQRGEWLEPGTPTVRIIRLNRLRAEGFAPAKSLTPAAMGRPVTLTVDLPGQPGATFSGELTFVSPEIDPINQQVRFWAEIENPKMLLQPGHSGQLTILATAAKTARPAETDK